MRWDAARAASRRQLPKPRKLHGPVGRQIDAARNCMNDEEINHPTDRRIWFATGECSTCRDCGYHVCSCKRVAQRQRVCGSCNNAVDVGWNYCDDCIKRRSRPHPNGCPCQGCVPTAEVKPFSLASYAAGSWRWAVEQMTQGKIVKREAWGCSFLRMRDGRFESMGDASCSSRPGEWLIVSIDESVQVARGDFVLVPPDDHSVHVLMNAAANHNMMKTIAGRMELYEALREYAAPSPDELRSALDGMTKTITAGPLGQWK